MLTLCSHVNPYTFKFLLNVFDVSSISRKELTIEIFDFCLTLKTKNCCAAPDAVCTIFFSVQKTLVFLHKFFSVQNPFFLYVHFGFVYLHQKIRLEKSVQTAFGHVQFFNFTCMLGLQTLFVTSQDKPVPKGGQP